MKKNNMLRIASVLLVAVLLSTCAISGAFAKYTTTKTSDTETARVAAFGIELSTTKPDIFAGTYAAKTIDLNGAEDGLGLSVSATTDVLAPGTTGSLTDYVSVTDSGREVAVTVAYAATVTLSGWTDKDDHDYCPIVINVGGTDYYVGMDAEVTDSAKLAEKVSEVASASADYAVGATIAKAPAISWRWVFDAANAGADASIVSANGQNDVDDTFLGEQHTASISIAITTTVTQID